MNRELFDLSGETAVVVGGTGVLGGHMAQALAGCGAQVVIMGRHAERGQARVAEITAAGGSASFQAADVLDPSGLKDAVDPRQRRGREPTRCDPASRQRLLRVALNGLAASV